MFPLFIPDLIVLATIAFCAAWLVLCAALCFALGVLLLPAGLLIAALVWLVDWALASLYRVLTRG